MFTRSPDHIFNRSFVKSVAVATILFAIAGSQSASAHHAFAAEYDGKQPIHLTGVVTKAQWVNPHSWLYADVKDADGKVTNWGFEFGAPFSLKEKGLNKTTLPVGTVVVVDGFRAKSGQNYAYASTVTLADGRVFQTGGAGDAPTTAGAKQ
ncbi:DUF6152 family protein [Aquirhabdus sp.]|uniref:DUF6152 family protein n=1 Tax=Aquirhabdus sp. TaxID=2824160 RepID=UPI00396C8A1D